MFGLASSPSLAQTPSNSDAGLATLPRILLGLSIDSAKKVLKRASFREEKSGDENILHAQFQGDSVRGNLSIDAIEGTTGIREVTFIGHFFTDESFAKIVGSAGEDEIFPGGKTTGVVIDGEYPNMLVHFVITPATRSFQLVANAR